MRAKSLRRLEAERLRREEGLSYNEIAAITGISKSTLSSWLKSIALTPEQEQRLQERLHQNRAGFAARALPINRERHENARRSAYEGGIRVLAALPDERSVHELAFAMLYLGEGAKSQHQVTISSTTPSILSYSLWVLKKIYGVPEERITCRVHLILAAADKEADLEEWWMRQLNVARARFKRTCYDRRPRKVIITDDYHGVCRVQCNDLHLQQHILGLAYSYIVKLADTQN